MEQVNSPQVAEAPISGAENFEEFFRAEQARLLRALYIVTGDRLLAEDVMQDAFVSLWERWERVRTLEDPIGYLYKTALNRVRRHQRRLARLVAALARLTPRETLYDVEDHDAVVQALGTLTARQRAAVVLTEMLGFDSETAGRLLGVKAVTARRLASKAREALRTALEGQYG
jgi:RNA polymerase sigma-70 factor (ECF subfamily)